MKKIAAFVSVWVCVCACSAQAAGEAWWKAIQGKEGDWINNNIVRLCETPVAIAEVERERALRIWNSGEWIPGGGIKEITNRYANKMPEDLRKKADPLRRGDVGIEQCGQVREWFYLGQARERVELARKTVELVKKAGATPPSAALRELDALEKDIQAAWGKDSVPDGSGLFARAFAARRAILFVHPALQFEKLLVNKNPPTRYSHNCDQYRGAESRAGQGPTVITGWRTENPKATPLLAGKLPVGAYQKPCLSFDAKRVVFGFAEHKKERNHQTFYLYEAAVDGSSVRQLTGTERDKLATWESRLTVPVEDEDPCYLPNGDIAFVSSRSQNFGRCHGGRFAPTFVLYRCDKNGDNITQLSYGIENETTPSVLPDGRILFTRWEYVDRHEMEFHKLWWKRPDGTMISHYYGNDTIYPLMISEARAIPGTLKVLANGMGHHNYHAGTIILIDITKGENGPDAVTRITPEVLYGESNETGYSTHGQYSTPWPLNENLFLATYSPVEVHSQGRLPPETPYIIALVDDFGGREPLYIDTDAACFSPVPVVAQKLPSIIPNQLPDIATLKGKDKETGVYMVQDVNLTRNDPEGKIKPGDIKFLRFNQIYVKNIPSSDKISRDVPNAAPKRILGTVPVEPDGSVSVRVPAGIPLQIQALDKDGRAILTERSFHYLRPGERRGCIGCHEPVGVSLKPNPNLFTREPRDLTPELCQDDGEGVSFLKMVQPVLDRHCIACHGLAADPPKGLNLIPKPGHDWPSSYTALLAYTKTIGDKGKSHGLENNISRPYDYYALGGTFVNVFMEKHKDKKIPITKRDFQRIVNWLDMNAQCYGTFNHNRTEYYDIDPTAEKTLRAMVKERFGPELADQPICALVNGANPAESRILMAPLPAAAGGWGQAKNAWKDKSDPAFKDFAEAVNDLFSYPEPALRGTCGYDHCRCGSCWVRRLDEEKNPRPEALASAVGFDLPKYDRAKLSIVEVDSEAGGDPAAKMLDGNPGTFWHSRYGSDEKTYPHNVTIKMADEAPIAGLYIINRSTGGENGFIRKYRVSVSTDGKTWKKVAEDKLARTAKEQRIVFDAPVRARYVKLTALSAIHGHNYASISELGVLLNKSSSLASR
ncbi:MAG: discoidin domain-containing protein [Kiritimatiellaeota bacterium]|nr:discoidin domain-containing protein [Kiritimatiellota bacterium]